MLYKADTGEISIKGIVSEKMTNYYGRKISAVDIESFPNSYLSGNDILIYTPEYVSWLEEKVEQLSSKQ